MSQSMPLLPGDSPESIQLEPYDASQPPAKQANPLLKVHKMLAGRYHWAIILGVCLGAIASTAAYLLVPVKFQSIGIVEIKPYLKKVVWPTEQTMVMPMYESYVGKQISLMQSQRYLDFAWHAMQEKVKPPKHAPTELQFMDNVSAFKNGELVYVTYTDKDPAVAQAGAQAVMEAYQKINEQMDLDDQNATKQRMQVISDYTVAIRANQDQIDKMTEHYGTDDLTFFFQSKAQMVAELELRTLQAHEILTAMGGSVDTQPGTRSAATQVAEGTAATAPATSPAATKKLTPEMLAQAGDETMKAYLRDKKALEDQLVTLGHVVGQNSQAMRQVRVLLEAKEDLISQYLAEVQKAVDSGEIATAPSPALEKENQLRMAKVQIDAYNKIMDKVRSDMLAIGQLMRDVRKLKEDIAIKKDSLELAKRENEQDTLQNMIGSRTNLYPAELPLRSQKNKRIPAIAGGGVGGLLLGFGIIALIGAFDRRLKSVADTRLAFDRSNRILGILPALPEDLTDPEQAATASFCVHHIRTLLQIGIGGTSHPIIAATSAAPGEGKTSLIFSLGLSYAATGVKTLLIDFDIIGAGLTSRANAIVRRKIGEVLVRHAVITREQLNDALDAAKKTGKRLGETLIEQGTVTQAQLDRALDSQRESSLGLLDVLDGEPLANCMITGDTPNLSILPMGSVTAKHVGQVSIREVQRIFREARESFDVVLVDTGPILGSLEASIVAALADEVILVVARGQQRPLIDKTFSRLVEVGARITGIVFNRAAQEDVERSEYSASYKSLQIQSPVPVRGGMNGRNRLGPVARAVASTGAGESPLDSRGVEQ